MMTEDRKELAIIEYLLRLRKGDPVDFPELKGKIDERVPGNQLTNGDIISLLLPYCKNREGIIQHLTLNIEKNHSFHFVRV